MPRHDTHVDRYTRVELALSVWRTDVLPLHQYRIFRTGVFLDAGTSRLSEPPTKKEKIHELRRVSELP